MRKNKFLFASAMFLAFFAGAFSQESDENPDSPESPAAKPVVYSAHQKGDQILTLSVGPEFPAKPKNLFAVGGEGTLGYGYFVLPQLFVGGNISFGLNTTIGSNILYYIPIMAQAGWQFNFGRVEVPLSLSIGGAFETYIHRMYFGLAVKPTAGCFFRAKPDWSFGGYAGVWILPQWYKDSSNNRVGVLFDICISARYHF